MNLFANTVVGVDGSPGSEQALAWATAQAGDGEVTAVHAFSPLASLIAAAVLINLDTLRDEHKQLLENEWIAAAAATGVTVNPILVDDNPASALRSVASRLGGVPIIVGHQGRGRRSRHHVGDTTNRLLQHADLPIIMTTDATETTKLAGTVVVGVHGPTTASHEPIVWAARLAAEQSLNLHIISVTQSFIPVAIEGYPADLYEPDLTALHAATSKATKALIDVLSSEHPTVEVTSDVLLGHPTRMLADAINDIDPALAIVGNYHHTKLASFVSDSVARHLPALVTCPVAAIPTE